MTKTALEIELEYIEQAKEIEIQKSALLIKQKLNNWDDVKQLLKRLGELANKNSKYGSQDLAREFGYLLTAKGKDDLAHMVFEWMDNDDSKPLQCCASLAGIDAQAKEEIELIPFIMWESYHQYDRFIAAIISDNYEDFDNKYFLFLPEKEYADEHGNPEPNPAYKDFRFQFDLFAKDGFRNYATSCHAKLCTNDLDALRKTVKKLLNEEKQVWY